MKKIMKKTTKIMLAPSLLAVMVLTLSACAKTDVVATTAIKSFESVLNADPAKVTKDENGFVLKTPKGTEQFSFGSNIAVTFELTPFVEAGLDVEKLPDYIKADGDYLIIRVENKGGFTETTANKVFEALVKNNREAIGYHAAMDHYGVALGNGNMFEWAKDLETNDKDLVFVLNPQPFADAGANVESIEGWVFAKVETMDNGKTVEVDKLLKPYNIK